VPNLQMITGNFPLNEMGAPVRPMPVISVNADGTPNSGSSSSTYTLASAIASLAPGATTTPITGVTGASYIWAYQFAGTTPSLVIETLGPDGTNYQTVATVTASGQQGIVLGQNSTVRLRNAGANAITTLSSSLT
jgi:hypothetical protein